MADTNLLVLAREYKKLREEVKKVLSMPKGDKGDPGEKGEKGDKGDTGPQGFPGRDGKDGVNGFNGKDGRDGIDGKDGKDGLDGVGVANAYIDFDNSLVIVLSDGREVNAGFLSQETKENVVATFKQGAATINELLPPQEGNANKFLKTDGTDVFWADGDGTGTVTSVSGTGSVSGITLSGTVTNSGSLTLGGSLDLSSPPIIGNTTPNAATFTTLSTGALTATGQTDLGGTSTTKAVRVETQTSTGQYTLFSRFDAGNTQKITAAGTANMALQATGGGFISLRTADGSEEQARITRTASAVNYVQVTGAATGGFPVISAQGSDANIHLGLTSKGNGTSFGIRFYTNNGAQEQFRVQHAVSAVNRMQVVGSASGNEPVLSVDGTDTNISMAFQSKGTGGISLSTGSTGTNLVNGTSVTALTGTAAGTGYTSIPSVAISAPTTAGGVQATATAQMQFAGTTPTVVSGGTGYTAGDVLTVVGGTGTAATITVNTVSGGVITAATYATAGTYSALPSMPFSVSGGTGNGATFNGVFAVRTTAYTITNAGSGYVEQPTVTFSGGGGSGAAAYATVGSGSVFRALGATGSQSVSFFTPGGEALRLRDAGGSADSYPMISPSSALTTIVAQGNANANLFVGANGSGSLRLTTNGTSLTEQLRVSHTASAVNYVQVTGAATSNIPLISAQGSDSGITLGLSSKGANTVSFYTNNGASRQAAVVHTGGTVVNYVTLTGGIAGAAPAFSVAGTDTNIDLALTPKGTGLVRFGTYTASMALTVQGYIEIKDSGGTVRRLAVVA